MPEETMWKAEWCPPNSKHFMTADGEQFFIAGDFDSNGAGEGIKCPLAWTGYMRPIIAAVAIEEWQTELKERHAKFMKSATELQRDGICENIRRIEKVIAAIRNWRSQKGPHDK